VDWQTDEALLDSVEAPAVSSPTAVSAQADTVNQGSLVAVQKPGAPPGRTRGKKNKIRWLPLRPQPTISCERELLDEHSPAHRLLALWLCALTLLVPVAVAHAQAAKPKCVDASLQFTGVQPRIALVIGNSEYDSLTKLMTPVNDAERVAEALSKLGFKVRRCTNATLNTTRTELERFSKDLEPDRNPNSLAVFYFAGHGLRGLGNSKSRNYMLPVEFNVDEGRDKLSERAIWLRKDIIKAMPQRGTGDSGANVIILDACREDEIDYYDGLWQVDPVPLGTAIAFAAWTGQRSIDRPGEEAPRPNSVYTEQFLKQLENVGPQINLEQFFQGVTNGVFAASDEKQKPRLMANLTDNRNFLAEGRITKPTPEDELKLWRLVEDSPAVCAFEEYLERFPSGQHAALAGDKLRTISERLAAEKLIAHRLPAALREEFRKEWAAAEAEAWCAANLSENSSELKAFPKNHWNRAHDDQAHARRRLPQNPGARGPQGKRKNDYVRRPARVQACQDMPTANPFNAWWRLPRGYSSGKRYLQARWSPGLAAGQARTGYGARAAVHRQGIDYDYPDRLSGYRGTRIAGAQTIRVRQRSWGPPPRRGTQPTFQGREDLGEDLLKAAEQGNVDAMYRLALAYEKRKYSSKMLRWLLVSSAMGNGIASYKLGRYYAATRGGYFDAVRYRRLARTQGYTPPVGLREER